MYITILIIKFAGRADVQRDWQEESDRRDGFHREALGRVLALLGQQAVYTLSSAHASGSSVISLSTERAMQTPTIIPPTWKKHSAAASAKPMECGASCLRPRSK